MERIKEFTDEFTLQEEWNWLINIAFYSGGIGAGLFLCSVFLKFTIGIVIGFLIVAVIKSVAHLLYLGHPLRFYHAFTQPHRSWISRGLISLFLFLTFGFLYIIPLHPSFSSLPWAEGSLLGEIVKIIACVSAFVLISYTGFVMAFSPSIPFWNNSALPIIFVLYSFLGGASLLFILQPTWAGVGENLGIMKLADLLLYILTLLAILFYIGAVNKSNLAAREAVALLAYRGGWQTFVFIGVVLILGLTIPMIIAIHEHFALSEEQMVNNTSIIAATLEIFGGFWFRYVLLRVGVYNSQR